MPVMLCRNRVADFLKWRTRFDAHADDCGGAGLVLTHLWRELDGEYHFLEAAEV